MSAALEVDFAVRSLDSLSARRAAEALGIAASLAGSVYLLEMSDLEVQCVCQGQLRVCRTAPPPDVRTGFCALLRRSQRASPRPGVTPVVPLNMMPSYIGAGAGAPGSQSRVSSTSPGKNMGIAKP